MVVANYDDIESKDDTRNEWGHGLGEGLARNTSLESFILIIADCDDSSKESVRLLAESLSRNTSLKFLKIKIFKCDDTSNEWGTRSW